MDDGGHMSDPGNVEVLLDPSIDSNLTFGTNWDFL